NDLVNFIGVPIAGLQAYQAWVGSGVPADQFSMGVLASEVETPTALLFLAGIIMVAPLGSSKRACSSPVRRSTCPLPGRPRKSSSPITFPGASCVFPLACPLGSTR